MNNLFVPYEISLKLKELGFDEECFKCWSVFPCAVQNKEQLNDEPDDWAFTNIKAPLYQQVIDWFETKHSIFIYPEFYGWNKKDNHPSIRCLIKNKKGQTIKELESDVVNDCYIFRSKNQVLNKAIEEAIKLVNV